MSQLRQPQIAEGEWTPLGTEPWLNRMCKNVSKAEHVVKEGSCEGRSRGPPALRDLEHPSGKQQVQPFQGWCQRKEFPPADAGGVRGLAGSVPGSAGSLQEGIATSPVVLPAESHGRGGWRGLWGHRVRRLECLSAGAVTGSEHHPHSERCIPRRHLTVAAVLAAGGSCPRSHRGVQLCSRVPHEEAASTLQPGPHSHRGW